MMKTVVALLPLFALGELFLLMRMMLHPSLFSWRECILLSGIVWGLFIFLSTEIFSLFYCLTPQAVFVFWITLMAILGIHLLRKKKKCPLIKTARDEWLLTDAADKIFLLCSGLIVLVLLVVALVVPPNNYDGMTYHMPRVVHWIQNRSVAHYQTHTLPQIVYPRWAEYAILHFQILAGGDFFAHLVQWLSLLGSALGVSLITQCFGGDRKAQIASAVFVFTLPMAVLQATSVQNDLVVAFWIVCFIYFFLKSLEHRQWVYFLAMGASLGLALLTKLSAYFFLFPFGLWFCVNEMWHARTEKLKQFVVVLVIALSLNAGFYARNMAIQKYPLRDTQGGARWMSPRFFVSNVVRNAVSELASPFRRANKALDHIVIQIHRKILKVDESDPRSTYKGMTFFIELPYGPFHEDYSGNMVFFLLAVIFLVWVFFEGGFKKKKVPGAYGWCVLASFLLFCLIIAWNPWVTRLHLPLIFLFIPFLAVWLSKRRQHIFCILVLVWIIPWILFNWKKPLMGGNNIFNMSRMERYFIGMPGTRKGFQQMADHIMSKGYQRVGLKIEGGMIEYPFWVLLAEPYRKKINISHVQVENDSKNCPLSDPPDFVVRY